MVEDRVDLSVLKPFTATEINDYIMFLRKNGSTDVAEAVEKSLGAESFMLQDVPAQAH